MPLYEYNCHRCGKTFELIQRFSDEPLKVHEDCGGELEKLISRSALRFKGSGWYVNDYGRGGKLPSENGGGKSPSETGGGKTEKKTPKPAAEPAGTAKQDAKATKD
jgi:putative FmdB family regulatory protein